MTDAAALEKRTLTINRTFNAPRSLVWEAWTQPEHLVNWWAPPGMKMTIEQHDFRVGGAWQYTMTMPDGRPFIADGVYSKIEPETLLESSANFKPMTEGVTIVVLLSDAADGKTDFEFRVIHPTEEYARQQETMGAMNGWGSVFNGLASHLESMG